MKKRKIIATLGPTSLKKDIVNRMDSNGVDIFRLNLSHTKIDDLRDQLLKLKEWTNKTICLDTEGKQLRTGELKNSTITIKGGSTINLLPINSPIKKDQDIPLSVTKPWNILSVGDLLSIDFNSVVVQIIDSFKKHNVIGRVIIGGLIGSNKGIYFEVLLIILINLS